MSMWLWNQKWHTGVVWAQITHELQTDTARLWSSTIIQLRLEDPLLGWLAHMAGKLMLAIGWGLESFSCRSFCRAT